MQSMNQVQVQRAVILGKAGSQGTTMAKVTLIQRKLPLRGTSGCPNPSSCERPGSTFRVTGHTSLPAPGENLGPLEGFEVETKLLLCLSAASPLTWKPSRFLKAKRASEFVCYVSPCLPDSLVSRTSPSQWPRCPALTLHCFNPNNIRAEGVRGGNGLIFFLNKKDIRIRTQFIEGEWGMGTWAAKCIG